VVKNKIPTETIDCPIRVSSPGGELIVNAGCRDLDPEIRKHKFLANLVVLDSQGLDVILGMDWMTAFEGVIDCANKTITLTTPEKKRIHFKSTFELKGSKVNSLKGLVCMKCQMESDLTYEERPIKIFGNIKKSYLTIKFCKVQWSHHIEEATWEREDELRENYPHLFASQPESRGRDSS
jgi:hypothetical protein